MSPIPSQQSQGIYQRSKTLNKDGEPRAHLPQVLMALSTPEGFPWITLSPRKAHWLINSKSSFGHLETQKHILTMVVVTRWWGHLEQQRAGAAG